MTKPDRLEVLFRRFLNDQETGVASQIVSDALLLLMLGELALRHTTYSNQSRTTVNLAVRAHEAIHVRYHTPLSTASLAREMNCNPDYLGRVFRKVYRITITEAIHLRRTAVACRHLAQSTKNIDEVARACGFDDVAYFRSVFKRVNGLSPSAWRRLHSRVHVNTY